MLDIKNSIINSICLARNNLKQSKTLNIPLYKNSFFIYLNTISGSAFGFIFWIIAARLYSSEDIGITSVLLSTAGIITTLSSFGFPTALIRFLPSSDNKGELFSSALLVSFVSGIVLGSIFIGGIDIFSPSLQFLKVPGEAFIFLVFLLLYTCDGFMNSGLLSMRRAEYSFIQNLSLGIRIPLLVPLIFAGRVGIFWTLVIAYLISFLIGIYFLFRSGIVLKFIINNPALKRILKYSLANYITNVLYAVQNSILPILMLNLVGAKEAGYFYVAFSIATLIYAIPNSVYSSMFVEGSYGEPLKQITIRSTKVAFMFLIPCGIALYFGGDILLSLFGHEYSSNSYLMLKLFIVSSLFVTINTMYLSIKKIEKDNKLLVAVNLLLSVSIITLSYVFGKQMGMIGVGFGWVAGQGIVALIILIMLFKEQFHKDFLGSAS